MDSVARSSLRLLDLDRVNESSRKEARNRETHLPPVSVYRWWARRTESVFGAIIEAYNKDHPGRLLIADPFAGGGVIPLAGASRGHQIYAQDLNPWAVNGLATALSLPHPEAIDEAAKSFQKAASDLVARAYATSMSDGSEGYIAHTFRVAVADCSSCGTAQRMFPHAMVSLLKRKERELPEGFMACRNGHLFTKPTDRKRLCPECRTFVDPAAKYTPRRIITCMACGVSESLAERAKSSGWSWEPILVERASGTRRELDIPTSGEIRQASRGWQPMRSLGAVPQGVETSVLLRHGFSEWADLYPTRQRAVTEELLDIADTVTADPQLNAVLKTAVLGTVEMAGHLSRWDRWYLKSYESMAGHRFNLTTFAAEPNVWGTPASGRGTVIRRLAAFRKAAQWLQDQTQATLHVVGPQLNSTRRSKLASAHDARIVYGSSERMTVSRGTVDLVLTDPPYHDDVQYGELSLPLRSWAGLSTNGLSGEAVVNATTANAAGVDYRRMLTVLFTEIARALRKDGHLVFSYANREPRAWCDLLAALHSAGLRAVGYSIVHSENETDHAKRNVRACTLDLILDLTHRGVPVEQWHPPIGGSPEEDFLAVVGAYFLKISDDLDPDWEKNLARELSSSAFGGTLNPAPSRPA